MVTVLTFLQVPQIRRLNTTSLALDACDTLQRPVAGDINGAMSENVAMLF